MPENYILWADSILILNTGTSEVQVEDWFLYDIEGILQIFGIVDIDDSEGAARAMQIRVYNTDENTINGNIGYMNGEAEYNSEQTSYMPVVMDSYDDSRVEVIKSAIDDFLEK